MKRVFKSYLHGAIRSGMTIGEPYDIDSYGQFLDENGIVRLSDYIEWECEVIDEVREDKPVEKELTGGSSDYYTVPIYNPTSEGKELYGDIQEPYVAECNDIIEALDMNYAEGNSFKAIWRKAAARMGNGKKGTTALYDAEKVRFFGGRLVVQEKELINMQNNTQGE